MRAAAGRVKVYPLPCGRGRLAAASGVRDRPSTSGRGGDVASLSGPSVPHPCPSPTRERGRARAFSRPLGPRLESKRVTRDAAEPLEDKNNRFPGVPRPWARRLRPILRRGSCRLTPSRGRVAAASTCSSAPRPSRRSLMAAPQDEACLPRRRRTRLVVAGGQGSRDTSSRDALSRGGRPSHAPPGACRGTASPPPTEPGDHGGSLGEGEFRSSRLLFLVCQECRLRAAHSERMLFSMFFSSSGVISTCWLVSSGARLGLRDGLVARARIGAG